jgi:hypothetical protein
MRLSLAMNFLFQVVIRTLQSIESNKITIPLNRGGNVIRSLVFG